MCILCFAATAVAAEPSVIARVQDGETGQRLPGVMVRSEGSDIMAVTDSSGECMVVSMPKKGGYLVVSRTGYLDLRQMWKPPARPMPDTIPVDLVLYANRPRVVVGRVFDAGTKLTIPGARVSVAGSGLTETAGPDGGYAFGQFPPGLQTLDASSTGYPQQSLSIQVRAGDTSSVDLYLLDTANVGSLRGTVFDAITGAPLAGAQVTVDGTGCTAVTDSTGGYSIENVPVGMNKVLVSREGYVRAYTVVRLVKDWAVTVSLYLREPASRPPVRVK